MIKATLLAAMIGSAAAFAPAQQTQATTGLAASELDDGIGAVAPLGYFDPLGYISDEETFTRYRAVERKHGRIAMMAMLGTFVHNNGWTFDGYLSPSTGLKFSDIDSGINGLFQVPAAGLAQIILFCGFVELTWWPASDLSGDYGVRLGTLNDWEEQPSKYYRQKNAELNNGRAAMMGIMGNMVAEVLTGQTMYEQYSAGHISPFGDGSGVF
uniref:Plastid light harvesting protein n=2 Tax=Chaetoceros debilis TaxID=122233 RepID=A0A6S8UZ87_9STRA